MPHAITSQSQSSDTQAHAYTLTHLSRALASVRPLQNDLNPMRILPDGVLHSVLLMVWIVALLYASGTQSAAAQGQKPSKQEKLMKYSLYYANYKDGNFREARADLLWILDNAPRTPDGDDDNYRRVVRLYEGLAEQAETEKTRRAYLDTAATYLDTAVEKMEENGIEYDPGEWKRFKSRFYEKHPSLGQSDTAYQDTPFGPCEAETDEFTETRTIACETAIESPGVGNFAASAVWQDGQFGVIIRAIGIYDPVEIAMSNHADFIIGEWKGRRDIDAEYETTESVTIVAEFNRKFVNRIIQADRFKMRVVGHSYAFNLHPVSAAFEKLMQRIPE